MINYISTVDSHIFNHICKIIVYLGREAPSDSASLPHVIMDWESSSKPLCFGPSIAQAIKDEDEI